MEETDLTWHEPSVSREKRQQLMGHRGCVAWFTGLSGSGKSTVANLVDALGDEQALGIDAGRRYHFTAFGALGFAMVSSQTMREAMTIGLR